MCHRMCNPALAKDGGVYTPNSGHAMVGTVEVLHGMVQSCQPRVISCCVKVTRLPAGDQPEASQPASQPSSHPDELPSPTHCETESSRSLQLPDGYKESTPFNGSSPPPLIHDCCSYTTKPSTPSTSPLPFHLHPTINHQDNHLPLF